MKEDTPGADPGTRSAVLGAGVLGLTVGLRLLERGEGVTVYEQHPLPGGLAAGFEIEPGLWLEKFYHHLFRSDRHVIRLIQQLGLGGRLEWKRPLTVTLSGGIAHQLDSAGSLLRFRPLPVVDRLRLALGLAALKALPSGRLLEGRGAADWIRGVMGRRAYEVVWGPLLKGKFGDLAEQISLPWFWGRVHDRSAQLGYVRGGFQLFYNALAGRVRELGGDLCFSTSVTGVKAAAGKLSVTSQPAAGGGSASATFDRVISTLPTRLTCRLAPELPAAYRERHDWGLAFGAHCVILELDRPLTGAYWTNVNDSAVPFMVLVEHTNYMPAAAYGGRHLVYLGNYRPMDDPLFIASQEEVLKAFLPALAHVAPGFEASWVRRAWMFKAPFAQPIVTRDYAAHIPGFDTPLPGLFVANMFQVYPHDRGQNYSVELAERLIEHLARTAR
ncbi:MAG: hypothetical protein E6I70_11105 [Chloroflexi bacterium]|nr:MAG: hypothetical protein E6I63_04045 [Chloroflexota bacterium]TME17261.1 MAG: hypothetical protein E6I70_11105 [Chloroflexota bacterium]